MAKCHKYKGVLAKPMVVDAGFDQFSVRLYAIFAEFGISQMDGSGWRLLALELAKRHVPGFRFGAAKRGRRVTPSDVTDNIKLIIEMSLLVGPPKKLSIRSAAAIVAKKWGRSGGAGALDAKFRRLMKEGPQSPTRRMLKMLTEE